MQGIWWSPCIQNTAVWLHTSFWHPSKKQAAQLWVRKVNAYTAECRHTQRNTAGLWRSRLGVLLIRS